MNSDQKQETRSTWPTLWCF